MKMYRDLAIVVLTLLTLAGPARADALQDSLVAQLEAQGYSSVTTRYTLLGRLQILADSPDGVREIVINPKTGEILRDYLQKPSRMAGSDGAGNSAATGPASPAGAGIDLPASPSVEVAPDGTDDSGPME